MIGKTISHYKVLEKLGEGGMGVVYKAQDLKLDRFVALKFLPAHAKVGASEQERFLQEAKTASSINHPNVCIIHAVEEQEGQRFIVMEYVDGQPLSALIEKGPLPFKQAVDFAIQISEALHDAHSKGIVHRDIKSDNIMVNSRNQVKVMDFGLAKLKGAMKLTRTSSTIGTLAYMAPEQVQGGETDSRSDIFSFGVLLFEMLSKHLPFRGEHEAAMVYSIVNEEPEPILKFRQDVPPELVHLINRTLEKDPADRYQSMGEVAGELRHLKKQTSKVFRRPTTESLSVTPGEPYAADLPLQAASPRALSGLRYNKLYIGIGALVVVAAVIVFLVLQKSDRDTSGAMVTRILKVSSSNVNFPNISADGNWIVFVAEDSKRIPNLNIVHSSGGEPRQVTNDTIYVTKQAPCFSPDAGQIVYERYEPPQYQQDIYTVSALGGASRRLISNGTLPVWSPDGKYIAFFRILRGGGASELRITNADGTNETKITSIKSAFFPFFYNVAWSADSKSVAFLRSFMTPAKERYLEIFTRTLEDSSERQITFDKKIIDDFCWTSTGEIVYNSTRGGDLDLWVIPETGGTAKQLTLGAGADRLPRVSKDAKHLVYVNESETSNLWTLDLGTKQLQQLTFEDSNIGRPVYSRDGTKLLYWRSDLFESTRSGFVVGNQNGSDPVRTMPTSADFTIAGISPGRWSPDSKSVLLGATRSDTVRRNPDSVVVHTLFVEHELGTNITRKVADGTLFDISRDGKYVLYRRDRDSIFWRGVLALKATPEKIIREISSPWGPPHFSSDSKNVISQDSVGIWFTPAEEGGKSRLIKTPKNFGYVLPLPDGKLLLGTVWDPVAKTNTVAKLNPSNGTVEKILTLPPATGFWTWNCSISVEGKAVVFQRAETKNRIILLDNFR